MDLKQTKILLNEFAKKVVADAKGILASQGKDGRLSNSLKHRTRTKKGSIILEFLGTDYANFVDQGVRGADPSRVSPNAKITGQQAPKSKFKFGSGTSRGTFDKFVKRLIVYVNNNIEDNVNIDIEKIENDLYEIRRNPNVIKNIYMMTEEDIQVATFMDVLPCILVWLIGFFLLILFSPIVIIIYIFRYLMDLISNPSGISVYFETNGTLY